MDSSLNNMTLRKALTQAKPSIPSKLKPGANSRNNRWPEIDQKSIVSWNAFNLENLNASYGHILDKPIPEGQLDVPQANSVLSSVQEISTVRDINHLIMWSDRVLGPTFDFARKQLGLQLGVEVRRDLAPLDSTYTRPGVNNGTRSGRIKADHVIELDDLNTPMLVLGLGRPNRYFPGRHITNNLSKGVLWPVKQLANLCSHSNTRYGYILTDQDFLACCFSSADPKKRKAGWMVAIKAVPWTKSGETQLTTDLALWWLCMLAISDPSNRELTRKELVIGIDRWDDHNHEDERGWVRRHYYSHHEEPIEPPPPPPYQTPSPDNTEGIAAAFSAEVGINWDLDVDLDGEAALLFNTGSGFNLAGDPMMAGLQGFISDMDDYYNFNAHPGPSQS
ncbi:hypothetical protein F5B18DRAFT_528510 [Nemania serpens]|nr:hypothetical protein F5B18DRAFT_528510 [Nemania serpens]